jgi:hypothetical protein
MRYFSFDTFYVYPAVWTFQASHNLKLIEKGIAEWTQNDWRDILYMLRET